MLDFLKGVLVAHLLSAFCPMTNNTTMNFLFSIATHLFHIYSEGNKFSNFCFPIHFLQFLYQHCKLPAILFFSFIPTSFSIFVIPCLLHFDICFLISGFCFCFLIGSFLSSYILSPYYRWVWSLYTWWFLLVIMWNLLVLYFDHVNEIQNLSII